MNTVKLAAFVLTHRMKNFDSKFSNVSLTFVAKWFIECLLGTVQFSVPLGLSTY